MATPAQIAAAISRARGALEVAGWTNIAVTARGDIIVVRGSDPTGTPRSSAATVPHSDASIAAQIALGIPEPDQSET